MAAKSSFRNMVLCLFAVCLVCSAILGLTYTGTKAPIEEASRKALVEALALVLPDSVEISAEARTAGFEGTEYEYYTASSDGAVKACAVTSVTNGFGGPLTVLVGVYTDGKVCGTKVLSHTETPGLGARCATDTSFIDQFAGFDGRLKVRKDGGDIDAITASTITSRAYTLAVDNAVKLVKSLYEQDRSDN